MSKNHIAVSFFVVATSLFSVAAADHLEMSEKDASRLSQYEPAGLRLACLDRGGGKVRKFYPIDNHHIIFFMDDGRIFLAETADTPRCRGLKNATGYYVELEDEEAICAGDAIVGESGRAGGFSGSGRYVGGTSRMHRCEFEAFQEMRIAH